MIGYAPFLGQIRLAGSFLGQRKSRFAVGVSDQDGEPIQGASVEIENRRIRWGAGGETNENGTFVAELPFDTQMGDPLEITVRVGDKTQTATEPAPSPEGDWSKGFVFSVEAPAAAISPAIPPKQAIPVEPVIPAWAWVAGGAAAASIVAWLIFRG